MKILVTGATGKVGSRLVKRLAARGDHVRALVRGKAQLGDGIELLRRMRERCQNPPEVIMLTGQATVESAIEAMKLGAYDYLTKPYRIGELSALVAAAAEKQQLKVDNQRLRAQIARTNRALPEIVAESPVSKSCTSKPFTTPLASLRTAVTRA